MDKLKLFLSCMACAIGPMVAATAAPANHDIPSRLAQWQSIIADAARQFGIPDTWISGVMRAESGGRIYLNGQPITSRKGAMGLMQIMPDTYRSLRIQYGLGDNAYDPRDNVYAGAAYLRQMYDRYGYPSLFAAYNAGPRRFDDFLLRRQSLPQETLNYVASIIPGAASSFSNNTAGVLDSVSIPSAVMPPTRPPASGNVLFFVRSSVPTTVEKAHVTARSNSPAATFSSTNNAALFVPLAGRSP